MHQLKGTFCHSVLERVFAGGGPLPPPHEAAERVGRAFDERIALDAAPLAQADQLMERQKLRSQLLRAVDVLVNTLISGGYRIIGIEVEVASTAFGKTLNGWIDCVAAREDGREAIIDFKYAGRSKYRDLIRAGRAVQLATYAYSRSGNGAAFPAVAYLVLADGLLYTPSGSAIEGNGNRVVIDAPAITEVWNQFSVAITAADSWLTSGEPIPARPLQLGQVWPAGSAIVLDMNLPNGQRHEVCRYCDYKYICGLEQTR